MQYVGAFYCFTFETNVSSQLVVKQFKEGTSEQDFATEVNNLRTVSRVPTPIFTMAVADLCIEAGRLTTSGSSTLGPTGTAANWIVTSRVNGKKLTGVDEFVDAMKRPRADCLKYLDGIYTQFVAKYVALQKSTALYHGDATNGAF